MKKNYSLYSISFILIFTIFVCCKKKPTPDPSTPYTMTNFKALESNFRWAFIYDTLSNDGSFLAVTRSDAVLEFIKLSTKGQVLWKHSINNNPWFFEILEPTPNQYILIADNEMYEFNQSGTLIQQKTIAPSGNFVSHAYKQTNGFLVLYHLDASYNIEYRTYSTSWAQTDLKQLSFDRPSKSLLIDHKIVSISTDSVDAFYTNYGLSQIRYDLNFNRLDSTSVLPKYILNTGAYFKNVKIKVLRNNDFFLFGYNPGVGSSCYYSMMRDTNNITTIIHLNEFGIVFNYPFAMTETSNGELYLFRGMHTSSSQFIHSNSNHSGFVGHGMTLDSTMSNDLADDDLMLYGNGAWPVLIQEPGTQNFYVFGTLTHPTFQGIIYKINDDGMVQF